MHLKHIALAIAVAVIWGAFRHDQGGRLTSCHRFCCVCYVSFLLRFWQSFSSSLVAVASSGIFYYLLAVVFLHEKPSVWRIAGVITALVCLVREMKNGHLYG